MKGRVYITISTALLACLFVLKPFAVNAFDMSDHWPIKAGAAWIADHDIFVAGTTSYEFGNLTGQQIFSASTYCDDGPCGQNYFYMHSGEGGLLILGVYKDGTLTNLSANPLILAPADMDIGDAVSSTVPAGGIDPVNQTTFTATLLTQETITVPAGTYQDALVLQLEISEAPGTEFVEKLWLARNVGPVRIERVSETPANNDGCFFTCESFNMETAPSSQE